MLYSNVTVSATERTFDFGTIYQVCAGEFGRGRKLIALTCPKDTVVKKGMNPDITIGVTKSGKPRINVANDEELFLLLSAQGGYTRRGDGVIRVLKGHKDDFEVLASGNGADGMAGRIGFWDVKLLKLKTKETSIIQVRTSGAGYGTPADLYIIHEGQVYHCHLSELEEACEAIGIDIPCEIVRDDDGLHYGDDWTVI